MKAAMEITKMKLNTACLVALVFFGGHLVAADLGEPGVHLQDFSEVPRAEMPAEFTWDLSEIYAGEEEWQADQMRFVENVEELGQLLPDWTGSAANMLAFQQLDSEVERLFFRLIGYADLGFSGDSTDSKYRRMNGEMLHHFGRWQSLIASTKTDLLKLGDKRYREYLADKPSLGAYRFQVQQVFDKAEYSIPSERSALVSKAERFAYGAYLAYKGLVNEMPRKTVTLSDGTTHTLDYPTFLSLRYVTNDEDRELIDRAYFESFGAFQNTFATLLDTEIKRRSFSSTARGFKTTMAAKFESEKIDPEVYLTTIERTRQHLPSLHRYLKLKRRLQTILAERALGEDRGNEHELRFSFDEAKDLILASSRPLGTTYGGDLRRAFDDRWIDRYPHQGKAGFGGATAIPGVHPYVLLNFTGSLLDVYVMAHELGHAMHYWSVERSNPATSSATSSVTDEIAALFNEHLLADVLVDHADEPLMKSRVLKEYLDRLQAAIFDQVRLAEFELAMHKRVGEGGTLSAKWLNQEYLRLCRDYRGTQSQGPGQDEYLEYGWMAVEYLYKNYYAINYPWGSIASLALVDMVKTEGPTGAAKYVAYLETSGTDYPFRLLENVGVSMTRNKPYEAAFSTFDEKLEELEQLVEDLTLPKK